MRHMIPMIILLALIGCAGQPRHVNLPPTMDDAHGGAAPVKQVENPPFELPEWFTAPHRSNSYAIGVARASRDEEAMRRAAREYATVSRARNLSSYNVNKYIRVLRDCDTLSSEDARRFEALVSSQTDLREQCDKLCLVDECRLDSYYIALFAYDMQPASVHGGVQSHAPDAAPDWYEGDLVHEDGGLVVSTHRASAADLVNALDLAVTGARVQLSRYVDMDGHGEMMFESVADDSGEETAIVHKAVAMETVVEMGAVNISGLHVNRVSRDGLYSYVVYAMMEVK